MVVSILALESATEEFLQAWNESPNPLVWTATHFLLPHILSNPVSGAPP